MKAIKKFIFTLLCYLNVTNFYAQSVEISDNQLLTLLPVLSSNEEHDIQFLRAQLEEYSSHKIDINQADYHELLDFPLFSNRNAQMIIQYRDRYGAIKSLHELKYIPSFSKNNVAFLSPYLSFEGELEGSARPSTQFSFYHEQKDTPQNQEWVGSSNKSYLRTKTENVLFRSSVRLDLKKDAGERWWDKGKVSFLNYAIDKRFDKSLVKRIVLGNSSVSYATGLVVNTVGRSAEMSLKYGGLGLPKNKMRAHSRSSEYDFFKGVGFELGGERFIWNTGFSFRNFDAKIDSSEGVQPLVKTIYQTGLHRDKKELAYRDQLKVFETYGSLHERNAQGNASVSYQYYLANFQYPIKATEQNRYDKYQLNHSIAVRFKKGRSSCLGEIAMNKRKKYAGVLMFNAFTDFFSLAVVAKYQQEHYQAFRMASFSLNNSGYEEQGLFLRYNVLVTDNFEIDGNTNWRSLPSGSHNHLGPKQSLAHKINGVWTADKTIFRSSISWRNVPTLSFAGVPISNERSATDPIITFQQRFIYKLNARLSFKLQYERSKVAGLLNTKGQSVVMTTSLNEKNKTNLVFAVFDNIDWNNRSYFYAYGMPYSQTIQALYGKGIRIIVKQNFDFDERFRLSLRYQRNILSGAISEVEQELPAFPLSLFLKGRF